MADPEKQDIIIKSGSGKNPDFALQADLNDTLLHLKKLLQEKYPGNPTPERQTLIHAGKVFKVDSAQLHTLLRQDVESSSRPISLHLVVKTEPPPANPPPSNTDGQSSSTSGQAATAPPADDPPPPPPVTAAVVGSSGVDASSSTSGSTNSSSSSSSSSSSGSNGGEVDAHQWYNQQDGQFWRHTSAASVQAPLHGAGSDASALHSNAAYAQQHAASYGHAYIQQYAMPYSLPPPQPLHQYTYVSQPNAPPASQVPLQAALWQPYNSYNPALSAAYSAAMASLSQPEGRGSHDAGGGGGAGSSQLASLSAAETEGAATAAAVGAATMSSTATTTSASTAQPPEKSPTTAAAADVTNNNSSSHTPGQSSPTGHDRCGACSTGDGNDDAQGSSASFTQPQYTLGGVTAGIAGNFPIVALVPVNMLSHLGLQQQQHHQSGVRGASQQREQEHSRAGNPSDNTSVRQSDAGTQEAPPQQAPVFVQVPMPPPAVAVNFAHPGSAVPNYSHTGVTTSPWSGPMMPPGPLSAPWHPASLPPLPVPPPFPPPAGFHPGPNPFQGHTPSVGSPGWVTGGPSTRSGRQDARQPFPPGPPPTHGANTARAPAQPDSRHGRGSGLRRRRHRRGDGDEVNDAAADNNLPPPPVPPPQGIHVAAHLRHPGAGIGGGVQPHVRGFAVQFNINMRAMLQGGVLLVLLYQNCPPGRFFALVIGGALLWLSALSPLRRWLQRLMGSLHHNQRQGVAPAAAENEVPAGNAPGGAENGDQRQHQGGEEAAPQRGGIFREIFALFVGFFTSLLPGWNLNPEDAAAFAAAQHAAAVEAAEAAAAVQ